MPRILLAFVAGCLAGAAALVLPPRALGHGGPFHPTVIVPHDTAAAPDATPKETTPAEAEFATAAEAEQQALPTRFSGNPDCDFAALLIPRSQAILAFAQAELRHGTDPGLLAMARDMVPAEERRMAALLAWQAGDTP